MKTLDFKLTEPIEYGGEVYETLTLTRLKAKHIAATDAVQGQARKNFAMFAAMADVPIGVIEELLADDFAELQDKATPLLGKSAMKALEEAGMAD